MIYKLAKDLISGQTRSVNKIDDDGQVYGIPFDPDNTDYQAYLKWVSEGNTPLPAEETT
jgi:hypothetical protein